MGGAAALAIALTAVVGPLATYVTVSRRQSGRIGSSDADGLWKAAEQMRGEYRDQLAKANDRLVNLEGRLAGVEHENNVLANENLLLKRKVDLLERENAELRAEIGGLRAELEKCKEGGSLA